MEIFTSTETIENADPILLEAGFGLQGTIYVRERIKQIPYNRL